MAICKFCNQPFREEKPWQEYCCYRHQQDWHLRERKRAREERLYAKLKDRETGMNGHSVSPEQQEKASEVLRNLINSTPVKEPNPFNRYVRRPQANKAEERAKSQEILDRFIEEGRRKEPKLLRRL